MFHYCAGILFYFYEGLIFFFSPFSALLAFVYILFTARFSRSSAGSALLSPREFYDPATGGDTSLLSGAGKDDNTGQTENLERVVDSCVSFLKTYPNVTGLQGRNDIRWTCSVLDDKIHVSSTYMCLFGVQWKQVPGIDRMVPLRLISAMTLQSKKSEEKAQSLFQDLHFIPL